MNPGFLLLLLFIIVPMAEVAAFITIGSAIGLLMTLGAIVVTAVVGSILVRQQGLQLLNRIRSEMEANRVPGRELVHGVMLLASGLFLLTPGFVTDGIGFALLVPPVRDIVYRFLKARINLTVMAPGAGAAPFGQATSQRTGASHDPFRSNGPFANRDDDVVDLSPEDYSERSGGSEDGEPVNDPQRRPPSIGHR